jgi:uncharacterized protein YlxP (DUF503 family)
MPIASLTIELAIEHAQSIKDRRQAVRSIKEKLRHAFNISVAELDDALVWNRATLGIVAISSSTSYLSGQLRQVESAVRRLAVGLGCEILDAYLEADVALESDI